RIRAVLFAIGRAEGFLPRSRYRQAHGARYDGPDLLGRRAVRRDPGYHGAAGDHVPGDGDALQGHVVDGRSEYHQDRGAADRASAAGFRPAQAISTQYPLALRQIKTPELSLRGFRFASASVDRSALRVARHEVVVTDFG